MNWFAIPYGLWISLSYVGVVLVFVAGALAARAVRGRPVGWQPTCGRCKHDLRGVDPDKGACPECGADLTRRGAVLTGRHVRSRRSVAAAAGVGVLAIAALWFLSPPRVDAMRNSLIASMPAKHLVDVIIWGGARSEDRELANLALWSRLGPRVGGATRTVPTGELLDAVLAAIARCDEPGRAPVTALLSSYELATLLGELDDGEAARLVDLAVAEVIASKGAKTDLVRCAAALDGYQQQGGLSALMQIEEALRETAEGRAVLEPRLMVTGTVEYGDEIALVISGPLDGIADPRGSRNPEPSEALILESAEATPEAGAAGDPARPLRESGGRNFWVQRDETGQPILIADLPPGKHALRVKGVLAPRTLLPARDRFRNERGYGVTAGEAAELEGARPFDQTVAIEVVRRERPVEPIERAADRAVVDAVTTWLKAARMQPTDFTRSLELGVLPEVVLESGRELGYAFTLTVMQDGKSLPLGRTAGSRVRRITSDCRLPQEIDPKRPFEITLLSDATTDTARSLFEQASGCAFMWVRGTLRFPSANRPPEVAVEPLSLDPIVAEALPRDEARDLIARLAASVGDFTGSSRRNASRRGSEFIVTFRMANAGSAPAGESAPVTVLSGTFELLLDGRLVAPVQRTGEVLDGSDRSVEIRLSPGLDPLDAYTLRYRPDPAVAAAMMPQSYRYVAEPFELRFTDPKKAPEVVWPNDVK